MLYIMNLHDKPFNLIKKGTKTIELRLNDEKRQMIKEGDLIEFNNRQTGEKIIVRIEKLYKYDNFAELYYDFDPISLGYAEGEGVNPEDMELYYTKEQQAKYGVLGIKIRKI